MEKKVTASQKIFVDPDEEIVFTLEKIRQAPSKKVIVVVPQNASLTSSAVSLKILARQVAKTDKFIVLVNDNETGTYLGRKANIAVRKKVSEVDAAAWSDAKELKESIVNMRERVKKDLLEERTETPESQDVMQGNVKATIEEEQKDNAEPEVTLEKEPEPISTKQRIKEKVIDVNGITLVAGGDIANHEALLLHENATIESAGSLEDTLEQIESEDEIAEVLEEEPDSFVGKDISEISGGNNRLNNKLESLKKKKKSILAGKAGTTAKAFLNKAGDFFSGKKNIQMVIVGVLLFLVISYIFLPAVTVTLVFAENEVKVNETVTASTAATQVNLQTLTIPATQISKESTVSGDGVATGKGEKGEKAKGVTDIHNNTGEKVSIAKNTVIMHISSQLKYVIQEDVTIPKEDRVLDVPIVAESFGEKYNIDNKNSTFKIGNFAIEDVVGHSYQDVSGGTSEEIVVVSKTDLEDLKSQLTDDLKIELVAKLKELISEEDILLEGSEKFEEVNYKPSKNENEEAENFTIDLTMSITARKIDKADLKTVAEEIVRQKQGTSENAAVNVEDPKIRNITVEDDKATFQLSSSAGVLEDINEDELKEALKGKDVDEAREYLSKLEGVSEYRLKYKPSYIPFFLQKVPNNTEKIEIAKSTETLDS